MSKEKIKPEEFSRKLKKILEEHDEETVLTVNEVALAEAKQTVKDIKSESKAAFGTGKYQRGWNRRRKKMKEGYYAYIIYNKTEYRLTHLLEHGHAKWLWGKGPFGTVPGKAHIRPVAEKSALRYFTAIKEGLNK